MPQSGQAPVAYRQRDHLAERRRQTFLTLHRTQTLADAPMTRHLGEGKPIFLEVHDPQAWGAIRKSQLRLFDAGFRIVRIVVELAARSAGINDFAIWRKYLRLERLRWEPSHGECGHNKN